MSIKGLFNQNPNNEIINKKIAELEKNYLKLNTLEFRVKSLLKLEEKIFPLLKLKDELMAVNKKISTHSVPIAKQEEERKIPNIQEEARSIEASILKKLHPLFKKVDSMGQQILELEQNCFWLNENQADILNRISVIEEKLSSFQTEVNGKEKKGSEQSVIIKEIRIDKFYLDKYEQNNNFAQLGIKELSGVLNIGATYGRDTIPKEVSEQIKEDFKEFNTIKDDFEKSQEESTADESSSASESSSSSSEDEPFTDIPIEELTEENNSES
ncbi:hypothetical protein BGM26_05995 [Bacillus sp. FJAT-29790]|uniref:hypothetical protein n=1 Tax=Bacillus sp. FJAT-29790 TaxID=1895002 RepID=UPI001C245257|nr:hypothetical protein [Bacillus sp. FJAT-29790]MBU8878540.1 hypothetical protein [Bacillus sp. FJAT-29790]